MSLPYSEPVPAALPLETTAFPTLAPAESRGRRALFLVLALIVTIGFAYTLLQYWVPAHSGVDQNGYLYGGRKLAETGTMKYAPVDPATGVFDPHQFVGGMWVAAEAGTPSERFYPKYPIGLPLLVAAMLKLGGESLGPWLTYCINPAAMTMAVFGTFLLLRSFCGSYLALLGQLIFAVSPVTMILGIDMNSHATAVCCVTWGMVGLVDWWKHGRLWPTLISGFLIGYATTIRYSEGTLLLPIVVVIALQLGARFWRKPMRELLGAALLLFGWAIPVLGLLAYNLIAMRTPTGYDPTNESKPGAAFTFDHFADNWETMLRHLSATGLFFIFPLALVGLAWMFAWRRRAALMLAAWILPCLLVYTFYYWAPDGTNIGYLRFFLTIFPALILCAMWVLGHFQRILARHAHSFTGRLAAVAVVPLATIVSTAVALEGSARELEAQQFNRTVLQKNAEQVLAVAPPGSAIFSADNQLFHHLQFMRDYLLFDPDTYKEGWVRDRMKDVDAGEAQTFDPARREAIYNRLKEFDQKALNEQQRKTIVACLAAGKRVFVLDRPGNRSGKAQAPRPLGEIVRRVTDKPAEGATPLFGDVVARWKIVLAPPTSEDRNDKRKKAPRGVRGPTNINRDFNGWTLAEISTKELPISRERQALIDWDAEQKAKREATAAAREEADKVRAAADQKKRDDDKAKRDLAQQKREAAEKAAADRLDAMRKAADMAAAQRDTATTQRDAAITARDAAKQATTRAVAERDAVVADVARLKSEQAAAEQKLENLQARLRVLQATSVGGLSPIEAKEAYLAKLTADVAAAERQLAELKAAVDKAATSPTTQPASE